MERIIVRRQEKKVKTRKSHECFYCLKEFGAGNRMLSVKLFSDFARNRYVCLECEKLRFTLYVYYEIENDINKGCIKK